MSISRRAFVTGLAASSAIAGGSSAWGAARTKRLTLLHATDTHAQLESHPEYLPGHAPDMATMGGFARLKTCIDAQRASASGPTFLVDGGDLVQGSGPAAWSTGEAMIAPANSLGLDAFVPGNWEPVYGPARFLDLMGRLKADVLAYNFHDKSTDQRLFDPAAILVKENVKVAIVGLADPTTTVRQPPVQVEGLDSTRMEDLREFVQSLRRDARPDLVVAVTHTGLTVSRQIAREIPELDVVLSGHTHERTDRIIREGDVLVVEAGSNGSFLGRLDLVLKPDGGVAAAEWKLIPVLSEDFAENAETAALVQASLAPYRERMNRVLGRTDERVMRYDVFETSADDWISDVVRRATGADVGFTNGFRFSPPIVAGDFTEGDLWNLLPLDSRIKIGWVTGEQLRSYLENELELVFSRDAWKLSGGWGPRPSGLSMRYVAAAPTGKRLRSVTINGKEITPDGRYSIAGCEREGEPMDVVCRLRGSRDAKIAAPSVHEAMRADLASRSPISPRRETRSRAIDLPDVALSQDAILQRFRRGA